MSAPTAPTKTTAYLAWLHTYGMTTCETHVGGTHVGGTQCMPLSAANTCLQYHHAVRAYGRVKLVTRSVGEQDSAADG